MADGGVRLKAKNGNRKYSFLLFANTIFTVSLYLKLPDRISCHFSSWLMWWLPPFWKVILDHAWTFWGVRKWTKVNFGARTLKMNLFLIWWRARKEDTARLAFQQDSGPSEAEPSHDRGRKHQGFYRILLCSSDTVLYCSFFYCSSTGDFKLWFWFLESWFRRKLSSTHNRFRQS